MQALIKVKAECPDYLNWTGSAGKNAVYIIFQAEKRRFYRQSRGPHRIRPPVADYG